MTDWTTYPRFLEVVHFADIDSTNTYLKDRLCEFKDRLPVLVTADRQSRGRGRDKRRWVSRRGLGLYSSLGFYLESTAKMPFLSMLSGLSVIGTLNRFADVELGLKWPNDVVTVSGNRKIAGILIENRVSDGGVFCIVGIGVNLNHDGGDFPAELQAGATSLKLLTGESFRVEAVNKVLAHTFFNYLDKLKHGGEKEILESCRQKTGFMSGRRISFHDRDRSVSGIFRGLSGDGGVVVEIPPHGEKIFYSGEIGVDQG